MLAIKNLWLMFFDPKRGFDSIFSDNRNKALIPLGICLFCSGALLYFYYSWVDFPWLKDQMFSNYPEQQGQMLKSAFSRQTMRLLGLLSVVVVVPVLDAALAFYLALVTKLQGSNSSFGVMFRLVCWAALPVVLLVPAGLIAMAVEGSGHLAPEQLNPVSLNRLIFHLDRPSPFLSPLTSLSVIALWQVVLMIIGLKRLSGLSTKTATVIVSAPYVVIYGGWIAVIALGQIG